MASDINFVITDGMGNGTIETNIAEFLLMGFHPTDTTGGVVPEVPAARSALSALSALSGGGRISRSPRNWEENP
jgi:hypothetical protein